MGEFHPYFPGVAGLRRDGVSPDAAFRIIGDGRVSVVFHLGAGGTSGRFHQPLCREPDLEGATDRGTRTGGTASDPDFRFSGNLGRGLLPFIGSFPARNAVSWDCRRERARAGTTGRNPFPFGRPPDHCHHDWGVHLGHCFCAGGRVPLPRPATGQPFCPCVLALAECPGLPSTLKVMKPIGLEDTCRPNGNAADPGLNAVRNSPSAITQHGHCPKVQMRNG